MQVSEAIDIAVSRRGRPHEDDWEAIEALETLASEVAKLRSILARIPASVVIQAKEDAGFANYVTTAAVELDIEVLRKRFCDVVPGLVSKSWEDIWERVRDRFKDSSR